MPGRSVAHDALNATLRRRGRPTGDQGTPQAPPTPDQGAVQGSGPDPTEADRLRADNARMLRATLDRAVTAEATALGFRNPALAIRLVPDGTDPGHVRATLQDALKAQPVLARRSGADFGPGLDPPVEVNTNALMNAALRAGAGRGRG